MRLLLKCNGFNNFFAELRFHSFCSSFFFAFVLLLFFCFLFFSCWLGVLHLKEPGTFSFNSVRWRGSWYFRPSSRGGLANFTPIAGMDHLISEPKFKIPTATPPPPANFWQVPKLLYCCFSPVGGKRQRWGSWTERTNRTTGLNEININTVFVWGERTMVKFVGNT